jgi:ribosomal-protein-alanine N-acetyltransferase
VTDVIVTKSGRLRLRRPTADDLDLVFEIHGDPATNRFNPDGPDPDRDASWAKLEAWIEDWRRDGIGYHVVEEGDSGRPVGFTGVRHADAASWGEAPEPLLNLYYRYAPLAWGKGYAAEAARTMLAWARVHRQDRPLVAVIDPTNEPSLRLAQKLGFRHFRGIRYGGHPAFEYRLHAPPA